MSAMDDAFLKIQRANEQNRVATGNPNAGAGMEQAYQGYFENMSNQNRQQQQLDLQKQGEARAAQGQAFQQNYQTEAMKNQKESQTNQLIGSAVGGVAQLGMQAYGMRQKNELMNRMFPQTEPTAEFSPDTAAFMGKYGTAEQIPETSFLGSLANNVSSVFQLPSWLDF